MKNIEKEKKKLIIFIINSITMDAENLTFTSANEEEGAKFLGLIQRNWDTMKMRMT